MSQKAIFDADADQNTIVSQMTVPTFSSNIWRSNWMDATAFRRLTGIVAADDELAANGIVIEQSLASDPSADSDAHYWTVVNPTNDDTNPVTGQAYDHGAWSVERVGLFARLVVQHDGVEPTTFFAKLVGAGIT